MERFTNKSPGALTMEQAIARHKKSIENYKRQLRQARELAAQGRGEDTEIAHVALGELVVPRALQNPEVLAALRQAAAEHNIPLEMLSIGNARNRINPNTGAPEFDFSAWFSGNKPASPGISQRLLDSIQTERDPSRPAWNQSPPQYMSSAPTPPQKPHVFDEPGMMPSWKHQAIASLPTDREAQKRALAADIFPGANYAAISGRIFEQDGRLGYTDWDGAKYYAEPAFKLPTSVENIEQTAKWAASNVGPAMSFVGGIAGAPLGGFPGSIVGAAVGETARQGLAHTLANEEKPWEQRIRQTGAAAISEGMTSAGPAALRKLGFKLPWFF